MVCIEFLGASGNFPARFSNGKQCFGVTHREETCAMVSFIVCNRWVTQIWHENGNNNIDKLKLLGQKYGVITKTECGELIEFRKPIVLWLVCTAHIDNKILTNCPIHRCSSKDCCISNCYYEKSCDATALVKF